MKGTEMVYTLASSLMAKEMARESMFGTMDNNSKENGKTGKRMDSVYGSPRKVIATKASGRTTDSMERDNTSTLVGLNTAAISKIS